ncbi:Protoheme IX farnesyltransferase, mitochondrial [Holothuria leucospilota]|uniref:Protoheme IX farnesyltransferase, mitochondrial n=1 Tax=Holothuria leucospilota TaxID=206669 RepID=A0A9Q1H9F1_HOLLE|nr:Protoheme IX farnesyltransferase, mitochondrial [Holothuria leucospilota]
MDLPAFLHCRYCGKGLTGPLYRTRSLRPIIRMPINTGTFMHKGRVFSTSSAISQKSIKPDHWKKSLWLRKLPKSTTAGLKVSDETVPNEKVKFNETDQSEESLIDDKSLDSPLDRTGEDYHYRRDKVVFTNRLGATETKSKSDLVVSNVIAQVTPCPIEPKDGNKEEEKPVMEEKWMKQETKLSELPSLYLQLSKSRLTGLVVISALAGYGMAPATFDLVTCALMAGGTFLTSCSANTINQFFEVPYDSQMARTRNRVLVRGLLSPLHAVGFASIVGVLGVSTLYHLVNPLAAGIAASTWLLYVCAYTPLKRVSIVNTWVGAVVGALPPMIGWAACTGGLDYGALLMAGFLYCWQFPHFNALSWNLRSDYSRGGYCMMATTDPALCRRVALRHCLGLIGLSTLAPAIGLTTWTFAVDSLPLNAWFSYLGWRFYEDADSKSARKLFLFSLLHLPVLMLLLLISKKDLHPEKPKSNIKVLVGEV